MVSAAVWSPDHRVTRTSHICSDVCLSMPAADLGAAGCLVSAAVVGVTRQPFRGCIPFGPCVTFPSRLGTCAGPARAWTEALRRPLFEIAVHCLESVNREGRVIRLLVRLVGPGTVDVAGSSGLDSASAVQMSTSNTRAVVCDG